MAVSKSALKIIKRAVEIRMERGEEIHEIVNSYPKLSEEQKQQIINELAPEDNTQVEQPTTTTTEKPATTTETTATQESKTAE